MRQLLNQNAGLIRPARPARLAKLARVARIPRTARRRLGILKPV